MPNHLSSLIRTHGLDVEDEGPPPLILVVDDDTNLRAWLCDFLRDEGYQTVEAGSGQEALAMTDQAQPDLILLDVRLPDTDGIQLCTALQPRLAAQHIPVLMVTGWDDPHLLQRAFEAGAADYVTKPFEGSVLLQRLRRLLVARQTTLALHAAKEIAEAASQAKSGFLAHISHEFRAPLTIILGHADLLYTEVEQEASLQSLKQIQVAAHHMLHLVEDILSYARLEKERFLLYPEHFDVAALVQTVTKAMEPLVHQHQNRLLVECAPEVGQMEADPVRVRQMLLNLLSNAAKFTEQGTITLRVWREAGGEFQEGDWLCFEVEDTGSGMTRAQRQQLFRPFAPPDGHPPRRTSGTGLGLAITQGLCALMAGEIRVESTPGIGTLVALRLPVQASRLHTV